MAGAGRGCAFPPPPGRDDADSAPPLPPAGVALMCRLLFAADLICTADAGGGAAGVGAWG